MNQYYIQINDTMSSWKLKRYAFRLNDYADYVEELSYLIE